MQLHDKNGVPIHSGDLLRSQHFIGARRKQHWLYHVAVFESGRMRMVPPCHLDFTKRTQGGDCDLGADMASKCEVIHGHGPGDILSFEDRPRVTEPVS